MQLLLLLSFLAFSPFTLAMTDEEIQCARDLLLADAQKAIESMSVEEVKAALEKYQEAEKKKMLSDEDKKRVEKLAALLLLMEKTGKVLIEDCSKLEIKEETPEAKALLEEIKGYCKESTGVWAEITLNGQVKFTFAYGSNTGTKSMTIGGGGNVTLGYRGHELKLAGNIASASITSGGNKTESLKYDHLVDYSLDIGIKNLESFLKWQGSYESSILPQPEGASETYIRRNVVDLGVRYELKHGEVLTLKLGTGLGISHLDQQALDKPHESVLAPSIVATTDLTYRPVKSAEIFVNTRIQRDFLTPNPRTVAGMKVGGKVSIGPMGFGADYGVDYDQARIGPQVNHQVMFNIFASVDPRDWRSKKKQEEAKKAKERERIIWEQTLERIREIRAAEEAEKKKSKSKS